MASKEAVFGRARAWEMQDTSDILRRTPGEVHKNDDIDETRSVIPERFLYRGGKIFFAEHRD